MINYKGMKARIFPVLTSELAKSPVPGRQSQTERTWGQTWDHLRSHSHCYFKDKRKYFKDSDVAETYFNTVIKNRSLTK